MNSRIFLDFDNCLASSLYATSEKHADELIDMHSEYYVGHKFKLNDGWYVTFRRSCAKELITFCKQLIGPDNVFILTTSIRQYIDECNELLQLGFNFDTHIFAREDIHETSWNNPHPNFKDTFNILVDDIPYYEHRRSMGCNKIHFLNNLPKEQFIQIPDFDVMYTFSDEEKNIFEEVSNKILEIIN